MTLGNGGRRLRRLLYAATVALAALPGAAAGAVAFSPPVDVGPLDQRNTLHALAAGPDGTLAAGWVRDVTSVGNVGVTSVRAPGGTFSAPADFPRTNGCFMRLAAAPDGTTLAVWLDQPNPPDQFRQVVVSRRPPGGAFGAPVVVSGTEDATLSCPELAIAPDGTAAVVWTRFQRSGPDVLHTVMAATGPAAGSLGTPVPLSNTAKGVNNPEVAAGKDGTIAVGWGETIYSGNVSQNTVVSAAVRPAGGSFGSAVTLDSAGSADVAVAVAPDGAVHVAWTTLTISRVASRPAGGSFGGAVDLSERLDQVQLAVANDGTVVVAGAGVAGTSRTFSVAVRPPGGAFPALASLGSTGFQFPNGRLVAGSDGTIVAIWEDVTNGLVEAAVRPPGKDFEPKVTLTPSGEKGSRPAAAVAANGVIAVGWTRLGAAFSDPTSIRVASTAAPAPGCGGTQLTVEKVAIQGALAETGPGSGIYTAGAGDVVYVGGFELRPRIGGTLVVDTVAKQLREEGAGVDILFESVRVPLAVASLPIAQADATVLFNKDGTLLKSLFSLPIAGSAKVAWASGGTAATIELELEAEKLAGSFGTFSSGALGSASGSGLKVAARTVNCVGFELTGAEIKADDLSFVPTALKVPRKLGIKNVLFKYERKDGVDSWSGQGEVLLPIGKADSLAVGGKVTITGGTLAGAGLSASGINRPIGAGFFLQRVEGELGFSPLGANFGADVTWGPSVQGKKLVKATGDLRAFALAPECTNGIDPGAFVGTGSVPLLAELGIGSMKIEGLFCQYATSIGWEGSAKVEWGSGKVVGDEIPNPLVLVKGNVTGVIGTDGLSLDGGGTLTLPLVGEVGGQLILSTVGAAACGRLGFLTAGISYRWGAGVAQSFTGCDLSPWRPVGTRKSFRPLRGPAGGERRVAVVTLARGLPVAGFAVGGQAAPPDVKLTAPDGSTVTASGSKGSLGARVVVVPVPAEATTYVFVKAPQAGAWRVEATGAEPLASVEASSGLPQPSVTGTISGSGPTRTLAFRITPIPGQQVVFRERTADGIGKRIATTSKASGRITFRPASTGQPARIEAQVVQNGLPRAVIDVVKRFTAELAAPTRLKATRKGAGLTVRWKAVAGAIAYRVDVRAGGKRVARLDTVDPTATIASVPAGDLTVTVVALPARGKPSSSATARVAKR